MVRALAAVSFGVGYLLCYFLTTALPTPLLWYQPLTRDFSFGLRPIGLGIDYYGRILWCAGFGGLLALTAAIVARRLSERTRARGVRVLAAWLGVLAVFTAGLYLFLLVGRPAVPELAATVTP